MLDLFQVANWPSFALDTLRDVPKGCGNDRRTGYALSTNPVGGIDKTKLIERMACGFRDDAEVFLTTRAAFAGNP